MGIDSSSKLYFGNLPPHASETLIRHFLSQHNGGVSSIVLKKGYAFVECTDQAMADIIIDSYQGRSFLGNPLAVEPAFRGPRTNFKSSPRIVVSEHKMYGYDNTKNLISPHFMSLASLMPESTYLYIPSNFVGAVIGKKGLTIRSMIRESGASLKIENIMTDIPNDTTTERRVTIFGPLDAHWKAQFLIFQKLTEDGRLPHDLKLTLEVAVPSEIVGRLIGRGGMRIKEIQADTGATIKFLTEGKGNTQAETFTQMYGTFQSLYNAQLKIRQIMHTNAVQYRRRNFMFGANGNVQVGGQREGERLQSGREDLKIISPLPTEQTIAPSNI